MTCGSGAAEESARRLISSGGRGPAGPAIRGSEELGYWVGKLPRGCELCMAGAKSVLFATGLCDEGCYYCPVSPRRRGADVVYVNDRRASSVRDVVEEVADSMSEGVGVTGGEPLLVLGRVLEVVRTLKEVFGSSFHVHLYTSGKLLTREVVSELVEAGLDEVRVHVISRSSLEAVRAALEFPVDVVVENPAVPGGLDDLRRLVEELHSVGVKYVNLNELEVSESNAYSLALRGFSVSRDGRSAEGSREVALGVIEWVVERGLDVSVHFCPAVYKDLHQHPRRLRRRALATRRPFEEVEDGVVRWCELGSEAPPELWLSDAAVRFGDSYLVHPRVARPLGRGKIVEALPTTPRRVLNEYSVVDEDAQA